MARSFKNIPGRPTFGVFEEPLEASEYIYNKKARATFCRPNNCTSKLKVGSSSNLLLFNRSTRLAFYPCKNIINKANLNINLITELDLTDIPVMLDFSGNQIPCPITNDAIPYLDYNIDPCGNLFGNTICGVNNFTNYIKYDHPYNFISYVEEDYGGPLSIDAFDIPAFTNWHCPVTNDWYKIAPNGYIVPFSETGLTTPNSVMSIAFLYDSLQNSRNFRNIFRFYDNNADTGGSRIPALFITPNRNVLHFGFQTSSPNSTNTILESPTLSLNIPYLISLVLTATTFAFYVNKTLITFQTYGSVTGRNANTRLVIGDRFYPSDGNLLIKDFTLYDGALTQTDVNNIYDNLTNMPTA